MRRTTATTTATRTTSDMTLAARSKMLYRGPRKSKENRGKTPATRNSVFTSSKAMNPQKMKKWLKPNVSPITRRWPNA